MSEVAASFERIRYELPAEGIARVVLARSETRNAQDRQMLYEIDRAFGLAVRDDAVKVIIVAADGSKQLVPGAVPYEQLKAMVDQALAQ